MTSKFKPCRVSLFRVSPACCYYSNRLTKTDWGGQEGRTGSTVVTKTAWRKRSYTTNGGSSPPDRKKGSGQDEEGLESLSAVQQQLCATS